MFDQHLGYMKNLLDRLYKFSVTLKKRHTFILLNIAKFKNGQSGTFDKIVIGNEARFYMYDPEIGTPQGQHDSCYSFRNYIDSKGEVVDRNVFTKSSRKFACRQAKKGNIFDTKTAAAYTAKKTLKKFIKHHALLIWHRIVSSYINAVKAEIQKLKKTI